MRVKIFHKSVKSNPGNAINAIEAEINAWLAENTDITINNIQLSTDSSNLESISNLFTLVCMIFYKRSF